MRTLGILVLAGLGIAAAAEAPAPQAIGRGGGALPPDILVRPRPCALVAPCIHPTDYFPLAAGNLWIYQGGGIWTGAFLTLEITQTQQVNGLTYFLLHGLPQKDYWLREDDKGSVLEYDPNQAAEKLWWGFQFPLGQQYDTSLPSTCCGVARVNSRAVAYKGPLGTFDDALEILYPGVFQVGIYRELFLPDGGLAFREQATGGPSYGSWTLIYARAGKTTLDSAPELSFEMSLDSSIYTVNMMPPVDPTTVAPPMTARIRLRNNGQPITLNYPSGQTYDFEIRDANGKVMYRWSVGQAFTMIVRTEVFGPGEKDFVIQTRLAGSDKNPLPAGKYVAEGWLTTAGARVYDATVGFEVRWTY